MKNAKKIRHIKSGWNAADFEKVLNEVIEEEAKKGWEFRDVKVESNGNNTLIIFERSGVVTK